MSERLYVAEVSPIQLNSTLTIKSTLSPWGSTVFLQKSKCNGAAKIWTKVFLIAFSLAEAVTTVPSVFFAPA